MSGRTGYWQIFVTTVVTLLMTIVPLPSWLNPGRPDWLLLAVIYWSLNAPMRAGQTYAFFCGLVMDALSGDLIGQHALTFALVSTITQHFQLRIRVFPLLQQAVVILLLVFIYHALMYWIDGIVGTAVSSWWRWLPVLTGMLVWPVMVAVLDTSNRRR
jgi:rod shape-determining protein MreD